MKLFGFIASHFGFSNSSDFMTSFIHRNFLMVTIPLAAMSSFIESYFGLDSLTMIAFFVLVLLELLSGIFASIKEGNKIVSNKFGRFGFKLFVWLCLMFVSNALKLQYDIESAHIITGQIFSWLHDSLMIYIVIEYFISVLENTSRITGSKKSPFVKIIKSKLGKIFDMDEEDI